MLINYFVIFIIKLKKGVMPFTIKIHTDLPKEIKNWDLQNTSDNPDYKKYKCKLEKKSVIIAKITILSILTFGIYLIVLNCSKNGKKDLANIKANRQIHYVPLSAFSSSSALSLASSLSTIKKTNLEGNYVLDRNQAPKAPFLSTLIVAPTPTLGGITTKEELTETIVPLRSLETLIDIIIAQFNEYRLDPKKVKTFLNVSMLSKVSPYLDPSMLSQLSVRYKTKFQIVANEMSVEELTRYCEEDCFEIKENLEFVVECFDDKAKLESLIEHIVKRDDLGTKEYVKLLIQLNKKQANQKQHLLEIFLARLIRSDRLVKFMKEYKKENTSNEDYVQSLKNFYAVLFNRVLDGKSVKTYGEQKKIFDAHLVDLFIALEEGLCHYMEESKKGILRKYLLEEGYLPENIKEYGL
jgi:hypothetical protein